MKRLLLIVGLLAASAPALAQQPSYPVGGAPASQRSPGVTMMCMNSAGQSVPLALCDQWPGLTPPFVAAAPEQRARVVTISPNSGSPGVYPTGSTPLIATATATTGGATATFSAQIGQKNYLCGFTVSPGSAGTAITITITTTGLTNNMSLSVGAPVTAVGVTGSIVTVPIWPCVPASATNTAITVVASALSTNGVGQAVNMWGYRQ